MMKKFKKWLQMWEGPWLLPLISLLLITLTNAMLSIFGPGVGIFPPGIVTSAIIAAFIFFTGMTVVNITINLYHRGVFRYYYGKHRPVDADQQHVKNDFKYLPTWLKVFYVPVLQLLLLCVFVFIVAQLI